MRCLPGVENDDARKMTREKWWCVLMIRFLPGVERDDALSLWCLPLLYGRYVFMSMYSCLCIHIFIVSTCMCQSKCLRVYVKANVYVYVHECVMHLSVSFGKHVTDCSSCALKQKYKKKYLYVYAFVEVNVYVYVYVCVYSYDHTPLMTYPSPAKVRPTLSMKQTKPHRNIHCNALQHSPASSPVRKGAPP